MTHMRMAGSVEAVLLDVMNNLTDAEIVGATGKGRPHFYKVANPMNSLGLHLGDAAALDAALRAKGLPGRFAQIFDEMVSARLTGPASVPADRLERKMCRLMVETGELAGAVAEAMTSGDLHSSPQKRRQIAREAQDVIDYGVMIRDAVEPPHDVVTPFSKGAA